jgi:hypothetical protein
MYDFMLSITKRRTTLCEFPHFYVGLFGVRRGADERHWRSIWGDGGGARTVWSGAGDAGRGGGDGDGAAPDEAGECRGAALAT